MKNKNLCGNVRTAYMPADTVAVYHHYIFHIPSYYLPSPVDFSNIFIQFIKRQHGIAYHNNAV